MLVYPLIAIFLVERSNRSLGLCFGAWTFADMCFFVCMRLIDKEIMFETQQRANIRRAF
jgi:hypothetical protein